MIDLSSIAELEEEIELIFAAGGLNGQFANVPLTDGEFEFEDSEGNSFTLIQDEFGLFLSAAAVPEPTTIAIWGLLGLGVGVFIVRQRRKKV